MAHRRSGWSQAKLKHNFGRMRNPPDLPHYQVSIGLMNKIRFSLRIQMMGQAQTQEQLAAMPVVEPKLRLS